MGGLEFEFANQGLKHLLLERQGLEVAEMVDKTIYANAEFGE